MGNMTLKAYLELYDRMSKPLQGVNKAVNTARDAMKGMKKELDELKRAQSDVSAYKRVQSELDKTAAKLKEATAAETRYAREVKNSLAPNKAAQEQLAKTRDALDKLKAIESEQLSKLQTMQERLKAAGIETKDLAQSESILAAKIKTTGQAMDAQRAKITSLAIAQRKLTEANEKHQETMGRLNSARSAGFESALAGGAVLHGMHKLTESGQEWQQLGTRLQVTGVSPAVVQHFQDMARHTDIKGISQNAALESMTEAQIIMRNPHEVEELMPNILKAKATLESLYKSKGIENASGEADSQMRDMIKTIELRGGTKSVAAFQEQQDFMMRAILGSGGVLKSSDWLEAIKTGGAATKMMSNEAFYYVLGHMIQETGGFRAGTGAMSAFTNLALGRTTEQAANFLQANHLLDKSGVTVSKKTDKAILTAGGLAEAKLFADNPFDWLTKDLVPRLSAGFKKGHGRDATDKEMLMLIPQAFSNTKAGQAFMQMYMDRGNIQRQLVSYRGAYNLDQGYNAAFSTSGGLQDELMAKYDSLKTELGVQLLPLLNAVISGLLGFVNALKWFAESFPTITKYLLSFIAIMGGLALVFGALLIVVTTLLAPILAIRGAMFMLRLASGGVGGTLTSVAGGLNALKAAGAAFIAWEVGQQIGGYIYDNMGDDTKDSIGGTIATIMAHLGSKDAQEALDTNTINNAKGLPKPVKKPPIQALVTRGQPSYAASHAVPAITQNFYGQTDPKKAGTEAQKALDAHERKKASNQRSALHDSE